MPWIQLPSPPPTFAPMINYHDRRFVQMANHLHDLQLR